MHNLLAHPAIMSDTIDVASHNGLALRNPHYIIRMKSAKTSAESATVAPESAPENVAKTGKPATTAAPRTEADKEGSAITAAMALVEQSYGLRQGQLAQAIRREKTCHNAKSDYGRLLAKLGDSMVSRASVSKDKASGTKSLRTLSSQDMGKLSEQDAKDAAKLAKLVSAIATLDAAAK